MIWQAGHRIRPTLLRALWAIALWLGPVQAGAEPPPYVMTQNTPQGRITIYSEYLVDEQGSLTLADILAPDRTVRFLPADGATQALGPVHKPVWIRFAIENRSAIPLPRLLELTPGTVALADFYRPDGAGDYQRTSSGIQLYPPWADLRARKQVYRLDIPANTLHTYYLRLVPSNAFYYSLSLYELESYMERQLADTSPFFLLLGLLLGLALINLIAAIRLKNRENLLYSVFLFCYGVMISSAEGFIGVQYLSFPGLGPAINSSFQLLTMITTLEFGRLFLSTRQHLPQLDLYFRFYTLASLICLPLLLVIQGSHSVQLSAAFGLGICVMMSALFIGALRYQLPRASFFLLARGPQVLIALSILLASFGLAPLSHNLHLILLLSISLEALVITLGILYFHFRQWSVSSRERHRRELEHIRQQSRSDVLVRLSHEVRTPMSGILGMAELLGDSPLTPNQRESVRSIRVAGENLLHSINGILDDLQLEQAGIRVNRETFSPEEALLDVFESFREKSYEKDMQLVPQPLSSAPALVEGDASRFRQIVTHVLAECFRRGEAGELIASLSTDYLNRQHLRLEVHGSSLSHSRLRLEAADHNQPPSLEQTRRACRQLGGDLGIRETRLHQPVVWITLPFRPLSPQDTPEQQDTAALANRHLLIVDDSQTLPKVIRQHAALWGMRVSHCRTSREALASLRLQLTLNDPYDVVIIDDQLPDFGDGQLVNRLLSKSAPAQAPGMIFLATTRDSERPPLMADWPHETLHKPVSTQGLQQALLRALEQRRQPRPVRAEPPQDIPDDLQILVAEDHHLSQQVIRGMLNKLGVDPHIVSNGLAALGAVQERDYDLILMDCEMPEMDGFEATRQIRAREQRLDLPATPIVALTAHVLKEHRELSRSAGMDAHLAKPVELSTLKRTILEYCLRTRHA